MLVIDEITSEAQFQALDAKWDNLLQNTDEYSPFLTHGWFRCCLVGYAERKHICVLVVRDGSAVIGIAPLWRYQDVTRGIQLKKIDFITARDTPHVDFIISPRHRLEVLKAILEYLCKEKKPIWDVLSLGQWPPESPNCRLFRQILRNESTKFSMGLSSLTPYVPIQGHWEAFLQTRSARFRKTHRNIVNRIQKLRNMEVQCIRYDTMGMVLKEIIVVAEKSWKQREGIAVSNGKEARRFFETLTDLAGQKGWLLVWLLKVNGVAIASEYDLSYRGKVYALRADFDEAYAEYSPGTYLQYQIIKSLFDNGYTEYCTGPGINSYKLRWTDDLKENVVLHIYNSNCRGRMVWVLENRVIPFLRRIQPKSTSVQNTQK